MASCTAVSVRDRGRFCFCVVRDRFERLGRGRIRRAARINTCRSENFFSSSRVSLCICFDFFLELEDDDDDNDDDLRRDENEEVSLDSLFSSFSSYRCCTRWNP